MTHHPAQHVLLHTQAWHVHEVRQGAILLTAMSQYHIDRQMHVHKVSQAATLLTSMRQDQSKAQVHSGLTPALTCRRRMNSPFGGLSCFWLTI